MTKRVYISEKNCAVPPPLRHKFTSFTLRAQSRQTGKINDSRRFRSINNSAYEVRERRRGSSEGTSFLYSRSLGADHLIFEGGVGRFRKKISCNPRRKKKNHAAYNREKKISCKRERSKKKFLHVNLLTFFTSVLCPQACKILHF